MKTPYIALAALVCVVSSSWSGDLPPGALARLGSTKMRLRVTDMAYSADGAKAFVITGSKLQAWDLAAGEIVSEHSVTGKTLRRMCRRADGARLVLADGAGAVVEWDIGTGKIVNRFETARSALVAAEYSPDGRRVLTLDSKTSIVEEWDRAAGKRLIEIQGEPKCEVAVYGPDGTSAFVGRRPTGQNVLHYDLQTGKLIKKFLSNYCVYVMALSPDRTCLLAGTRSYGSEWRIEEHKRLMMLRGHHGGAVIAVAYAPDMRHLLTGSRDGSIRLWDRSTGKVARRWFPHQRYVTKLRVSPDGKWVLSWGKDGLLTETSLAAGEPRHDWPRHSAAIHAVACAPDGSAVVTGSADRTIRVWHSRTWQCLRTILCPGLDVYALAVSPDGSRVLAGCKDGTVREMILADGKETLTLKGHLGYVRAVAYAGATRISAADDGVVRVWDNATGKPARMMKGHMGGVLAIAVSPDGKSLVTGGRDGTVREWDIATGRQRHSALLHRAWVVAVAYSQDGARVLSADRRGGAVELDRADWSARRTLDHGASLGAACYTTDGAIVTAGGAGKPGQIALWDADAGKPMRSMKGHSSMVTCMATAPNGRWMVSGSTDTTAVVWAQGNPLPVRP